MRAKNIMQILSRLSGVTGSDTVKRWLCVLIAIAIIGALGPISSSQEVQQKSWLFTSNSFIFHSHFLDNLIQEEYVLLDNENDEDDFTVEGSQIFRELFSIANIKFLTSPLNSHWEIFFDAIKSSPYISFFASPPLRSPPLFS